jgi:outer membrane protein OmpA-like peptidoglycan-associated protein
MIRSRIAIVVPAVALLLSGCATKDWVNETLGKERVETDEKVGRVEQQVTDSGWRLSGLDARISDESKRVDVLGGRVREVDGAATSARERADDAVTRAERAAAGAADAGVAAKSAVTRADQAFARADDVDARLTRLWNSRHKRSVVETTHVQFGFDRSELDDRAQTALVGVADELKKNGALGVVLEGYTDSRGGTRYNLELSRRRVEAVRRYLVARGVELWRINAIGLGALAQANVPDTQKRRVSVTLTVAE